uniref:Cilia- and flagella-associated protein 61 N-terminal domain-containing protein n=1 Tax=Timema douglasi TaxID=61478 RepID=A0A7R8VT68_TIMDO|nr:unnamed protein product [Timema douglasi]
MILCLWPHYLLISRNFDTDRPQHAHTRAIGQSQSPQHAVHTSPCLLSRLDRVSPRNTLFIHLLVCCLDWTESVPATRCSYISLSIGQSQSPQHAVHTSPCLLSRLDRVSPRNTLFIHLLVCCLDWTESVPATRCSYISLSIGQSQSPQHAVHTSPCLLSRLDRVSPRNTLFIHLLVWDSKHTYEFLRPLLQSLFQECTYLHNIMITVPPKVKTFDIFDEYFTHLLPLGGKDFSRIQTILLCVRQRYLKKMKIRHAREEDHDDLMPLFDRSACRLREQFGEFFISELISSADEKRHILVAESQYVYSPLPCSLLLLQVPIILPLQPCPVSHLSRGSLSDLDDYRGGTLTSIPLLEPLPLPRGEDEGLEFELVRNRVVGMLSLSSNVNYTLLNRHFELVPFYGLRQPDERDKIPLPAVCRTDSLESVHLTDSELTIYSTNTQLTRTKDHRRKRPYFPPSHTFLIWDLDDIK